MKPYFRALYGPFDWGWINQQVGIIQCEDTTGITAIDLDTNETVGACVMDNWTNNSVQAHFMVSTPMILRHGFLEECFDFMFNEKGLKYIYGMVPANNAKALKLNKHMGFTERLRLPEAYADGVDYVVMELTRDNCKYLPIERAA